MGKRIMSKHSSDEVHANGPHKYLEVWNEWHDNRSPTYPHEKVIQFVKRNFGEIDSQELTALDLGCGSGVHLEFLARMGFAVSGIDASPRAIENSKRRLAQISPTAKLTCTFLSEAKLPKDSYDCIVSTGVLDFAGPIETRSIAPLIEPALRPGGKALLIFAADGDFRQELHRDMGLHCYTRAEVNELFASSEKLQVWLDEYSTTYENGTIRQIDWLVTLRKLSSRDGASG